MGTASDPVSSASITSGAQWSKDELLEWLSNSIDRTFGAFETNDQATAQKAFSMWIEWADVEHHIPPNLNQNIVNKIDQSLREQGFPSLREPMMLCPLTHA